jgi:hyaluronan synthase
VTVGREHRVEHLLDVWSRTLIVRCRRSVLWPSPSRLAARVTLNVGSLTMNDDSMLTFYALLAGKAVHQPTAVAYTVVPERCGHYLRQQLRWMRGTFVRTWWWFRYMPLRDAPFWMPLTELFAIVLSAIVIVTLAASPAEVRGPVGQLLLISLAVDLGVNWMLGLRYLVIRRSDETLGFQLGLVAAPRSPGCGVCSSCGR